MDFCGGPLLVSGILLAVLLAMIALLVVSAAAGAGVYYAVLMASRQPEGSRCLERWATFIATAAGLSLLALLLGSIYWLFTR